MNTVTTLLSNKLTKGFTLVEMLVSMGLLSILLLILSSAIASVTQAKLENTGSAMVQLDAQSVFSRLRYDLRRSQTILQPALGSGAANNLELLIDGDQFIYRVIDNRLALETSSGNEFITSSETSISELQVSMTTERTISIQLTVTSKALDNGLPYTQTYKTVVGTKL